MASKIDSNSTTSHRFDSSDKALSTSVIIKPQDICFSWDSVSVVETSTSKHILNDISGWIRGGEMIGILGASGAGKSTLLNALVGMTPAKDFQISGTISVNGADRSTFSHSKWCQFIGYVEQDDILYPNLTVRETLTYSASLQLWKMAESERRKAVSSLLASLSLEKCADSLVGLPGAGISGGERKRLATALQLITDPSILFFDEPTSGLDSNTALQVVSRISELTKLQPNPKAIIMTIHQPRLNILRLFSRILLLSPNGGRCIYFGTVDEALKYFAETLNRPCPELENPGDHFLDMSIEHACPAFPVKLPEVKEFDNLNRSKSTAPFLRQFITLLKQNSLMSVRDYFMVFSIFMQAFIFAILIGFTTFQLPLTQPAVISRLGILFFLSMNTMFSVIQPIIIVLPLEKAIVVRERLAKTYSPTTSLIAKFLVLLPLRIMAVIFLSTLLWLISGLHRGWDHYGILISVTSSLTFVAVSLGLFIGAISPSLKLSQILAPLIISVFMVYGGNMSPTVLIPKPLAWLQYISPVRYAYTALCQNEFRGLVFTGTGYANGEQVLTAMDMNNFSISSCISALLAMGIVTFIGAVISFSYVTRPCLNLRIKYPQSC